MALNFKTLNHQNVGSFRTAIQFLAKQRTGHFDFSLSLKDTKGSVSLFPVFEGICSKGNSTQGIRNWFDFHYFDRADFGDGHPFCLSQRNNLAVDVFRLMGTAVEPGGMLFVSYITDMIWNVKSELHSNTRSCLSVSRLKIPAVATPLGRLLFSSGCSHVKSQAFDVQGSSRIAAEKAVDFECERRFLEEKKGELEAYLKRKPLSEYEKLEALCRANAVWILGEIDRMASKSP